MKKVCFYILIGNIILHFGTLTIPFQHNLPRSMVRRHRSGCDKGITPPFPGVVYLGCPGILLPSEHSPQ